MISLVPRVTRGGSSCREGVHAGGKRGERRSWVVGEVYITLSVRSAL